jgi:hypothetical protein
MTKFAKRRFTAETQRRGGKQKSKSKPEGAEGAEVAEGVFVSQMPVSAALRQHSPQCSPLSGFDFLFSPRLRVSAVKIAVFTDLHIGGEL